MIQLQRHNGFSLIELTIVVAIVGILAAIATPMYIRMMENVELNLCAADVITLAAVFHQYHLDHDSWPAKSPDHGVAPPEIEPYLDGFDWSETRIGGKWFWAVLPNVNLIGVGISPYDMDRELLVKLDEKIDDGNLSTGAFRKNRNRYLYILEETD